MSIHQSPGLITDHRSLITCLLLSAFLLQPSALLNAFPPAPHHLFMGTVRDEYGNPITASGAKVIFDTPSGRSVTTMVRPGLGRGVNYKLAVPMDSGITDDAYAPTAMAPTLPFTIRVRIGQVDYLPIELKGDFGHMGEAGETTRLNLTLGVDSDGDGLPDAWEQSLISAFPNLKTLEDVKGGDDSDGDGMSNLAEYLAGSYAFDPGDGFELKIKRFNAGRPVMEFLAVHGRTYTVYGSANLKNWEPVEIRRVGETDSFQSILAQDVSMVEIETAAEPSEQTFRYFKLLAQ